MIRWTLGVTLLLLVPLELSCSAADWNLTSTTVSIDSIPVVSGSVDSNILRCGPGTPILSVGTVAEPVVNFSLDGTLQLQTLSLGAFHVTAPAVVQADFACDAIGSAGQTLWTAPMHFELTNYSAEIPSVSGTFDPFTSSLETSLAYVESFNYNVTLVGVQIASGTASLTVSTPAFFLYVEGSASSAPSVSVDTDHTWVTGGGGASTTHIATFTGSIGGHSLDLAISATIRNVIQFATGVTTTTLPPVTSTTTTTLPPGGSPCATLDSCRDVLAAALPGVDINGSQKSQRVARALQKLNSAADHALDQGAASASGQKRHRWYAKARAALTRLLKVARAASDRATRGVPLPPIEAVVATLRGLLLA